MSRSAEILVGVPAEKLSVLAKDLESLIGAEPTPDVEGYGFALDGHAGSVLENHEPLHEPAIFGAEVMIDSHGTTDLRAVTQRVFDHLRALGNYKLRLLDENCAVLEEFEPKAQAA